MGVEFEFDEEKIKALGYTLADVHRTIKKAYKKYGLPCISDGKILAFSDLGRKDDYSHLWAVIMRLVRCEWFLEVATACYWCEDGQRVEDILTQAKARDQMRNVRNED